MVHNIYSNIDLVVQYSPITIPKVILIDFILAREKVFRPFGNVVVSLISVVALEFNLQSVRVNHRDEIVRKWHGIEIYSILYNIQCM